MATPSRICSNCGGEKISVFARICHLCGYDEQSMTTSRTNVATFECPDCGHENFTSAMPMRNEDNNGRRNVAPCNGCERRLHFSIWPSTNAFKPKNMCRHCEAVWCNICRKQLKTVRIFGVVKVEICGSCGSSLGRTGVLDVRFPTA